MRIAGIWMSMLIVLLGFTAPAPAVEKPKPLSDVTIVDAAGTTVGALAARGPINLVGLEYKHHSFFLVVRTDTLIGNNVWFESIDCSGPPLMDVRTFSTTNVFDSQTASLFGPELTFYLIAPNATPQSKTANSTGFADFVNGSFCVPVTFTGLFVPAVVGGDLRPLFTPPFSIK